MVLKYQFVKKSTLLLFCILLANPLFAEESGSSPAASTVQQKPTLSRAEQAKLNADLVYKAYFGTADEVLQLADNGADVNAVNNRGTPALALAAERRDKEGIEVMKALLASGANINQTDKNKQTALFYAARNDNKEAVTLLLDQGIEYYRMDKDGNVARNLAYTQGHMELFEYMDHYVDEKREAVMDEYKARNAEKVEQLAAEKQRKEAEQEAARAAEAERNKANLAALEKLRESFRGDAFAQSVRSLSYETCAYQYWVFVQRRNLTSSLSTEMINTQASERQQHVKLAVEVLVKEYHADKKFIENITEPSKKNIAGQLAKLGSNVTLKSNGVGEETDMHTRCFAIADNWEIHAEDKK